MCICQYRGVLRNDVHLFASHTAVDMQNLRDLSKQ